MASPDGLTVEEIITTIGVSASTKPASGSGPRR
jgi:hypothetical protein